MMKLLTSVALLLMAACVSSPSRSNGELSPSGAARKPVQPALPTEQGDRQGACSWDLALVDASFERPLGAPDSGWSTHSDGAIIAADGSAAHQGSAGVQVHLAQNGEGAIFQDIDATGLTGAVVKISAWVRPSTSDVRPRVFGASLGAFSDVIDAESVKSEPSALGSWQRLEVSLRVDEKTRVLRLGVRGAGTGDFAVDDIHACSMKAPPPVAIQGSVRSASGTPVGSATVAAFQDGMVAGLATTDRDGMFTLTLPAGDYSLSAWQVDEGAAFGKELYVTADGILHGDAELRLGDLADSQIIEADVEASPDMNGSEKALGIVSRVSHDKGDVFAVPIGKDGHLRARLPRAEAYRLSIDGDGSALRGRWVATPKGSLLFSSERFERPSTDQLKAIKAASFSWSNDDLRSGTHLAALGISPNTSVIGLGENSHGTAEIVTARCDLTIAMAEYFSVRLVAIEAPLQDTRPVNEYVLGGAGDSRSSLTGLFEIYQTQEMASCLERLRAWNSKRPARDQIRVVGLDIQEVEGTYTELVAFLGRSGTSGLKVAWQPLKVFEHDDRDYAKDAKQISSVDGAFAALEVDFKTNRKRWVALLGADKFEWAREDLFTLARIHQFNVAFAQKGFSAASAIRDRAMAERLFVEMARLPKGAKVAVWAHSVHLRKGHEDDYPETLGEMLAHALPKRYFAIAIMMGNAGFQAYDGRMGKRPLGLRGFELGPPKEWTIEGVLSEVDGSVVGLRSTDSGSVDGGAWLRRPTMMRVASAMVSSIPSMLLRVTPSVDFDAYLLMKHATRATPLRSSAQYP